jgi:hypothetical protein
MKSRSLIFAVLLVVVLSGCKSNMERQDDAYLRNQELSKDFAQRWPAFEEFLVAGDKAAEKLYDEAEGLEEDARAAKLEEANGSFGAAFHALRQYVNLERSIRSKMETLDNTRAKSYSTGSDKRALWEDTDRVLEEAHKAIAELKPENEGQGAAEVSRQVSRLQTLDKRVSTVLEKAEREVRKDRERKQSQAQRKQKKSR